MKMEINLLLMPMILNMMIIFMPYPAYNVEHKQNGTQDCTQYQKCILKIRNTFQKC